MSTSTRDLHVFESGSGGELALLSGDLVLVESLYQSIYLALFGGNVEASTIGNEIPSEERSDYWANTLIFQNRPSKQYNSETERTLSSTPLNSSGRLKIEASVKQDLQFLSDIVEADFDVSILAENKVEISVTMRSISNQADKQIQFIWDNAKKEVIIERTI